jgi:hypothetical protein
MCENVNRRPHAEEIIAWANGYEIQIMSDKGLGWQDAKSPRFLPQHEYRVKPKVKKYRWLLVDTRNKDILVVTQDYFANEGEASLHTMCTWFAPLEPIQSTMIEA